MLLLFLLFPLICAQHLNLTLHRHQGCPWKKTSPWHRKLSFEGGHSGKGAQLASVQGQQGCYSIHGSVTVHEDVTEEVLIYLAVGTTGDSQKPPEVCRDANPETGCGGIGSCLYCRPCESLDSLTRILGAQLVVDGKVVGCEPLKKGVYRNVELRFCLPELSALLEWQGISESAIESIIAASTADGKSAPKLSLFVTVYVFDKNVKPLLVSQRKLESRLRDQRGVKEGEQLDASTYWNLPFNQMIKKQQMFIGCHKLFGTVTAPVGTLNFGK